MRSPALLTASVLLSCIGCNETPTDARVLPATDYETHRLTEISPTILDGVVGFVVTPQPEVRVIDRNNPLKGLAGVEVTFTVTGGGGSIGNGDVVKVLTDAWGLATAPWVLGSAVGTNALTAKAHGIAKTVNFVATAHASR
jgi:hypothetical protein